MSEPALRITEVFHSLQGETSTAGLPTVFVRLTGCPLRCQYCDTAYAFSGGEMRSIDDLLTQVTGYGARHVTVTGGEPLAQPDCHVLLAKLADAGFDVGLETSGALDVTGVDHRIRRIIDLKTPGSGEVGRNLWSNLADVRESDQIKFVICSRQDYDWARLKSDEYDLYGRAGEVLFSPSFTELEPSTLAAWILEDRLPVRFQLQLHKILWNDEPGR
ncbi:MAG: 7-carboxy-7-deazaguanine synthase QueE [Pseudomonadaceae bacterium]|nr:7-carboxy-7-deazaguanine synthase QueE [Pseudomonadaceae bacterium]